MKTLNTLTHKTVIEGIDSEQIEIVIDNDEIRLINDDNYIVMSHDNLSHLISIVDKYKEALLLVHN